MPDQAQAMVEQLYRNMERRIAASPPGLCPVDMALNFLNLCQAQTCGKCVPCRIGLAQLSNMIREVLEGEPQISILRRIENTAQVIVDTADCAIGIDAANLVLMGLKGFRDDYEEHILHHRCLGTLKNPVPCVALCPAGVDIPGYISLVSEGRCADAVRLIRKDNPFPIACAYICEHPCEARCRRNMVDDALNIRGLKRYAVDHAGDVPQPKKAPATGKSVAIVGGGPGGLSAAYYLALMGHKVTVYEKQSKLGGMMRYGIPSYRFPREKLDSEIDSILSLGIEVHTGVKVGQDVTFDQLKKEHDCVYISIGAHTDKKTGIKGEDSAGVMSAVELLRRIGDDEMPDFTGQNVAVIGGGNVAMDVTRSAIRLGAAKVTCVYRRRQEDMTAQQEEVEGAIAEGAEVLTLQAPLKIEADESGHVTALWTQPQIIDEIDKADLEFPNDLLWELDKMEFYIPETKETIAAKQRPIVIITSNAEKELPDAFLRRCVFHYIEFPEQEQMEAILRVHFGDLEEKLVKQSLAAFYWLRELRGIEKKPSTSELVDWIRALVAGGVDPARIEKEIPFAGVLLKKDKDLQTLRKVK